MRVALPGIGGSLGECVVCGESFAAEIMLCKSVPMVSITGFSCDLPYHEKCKPALEIAASEGWEKLPGGPLRSEFAKAAAQREARAARHAETGRE